MTTRGAADRTVPVDAFAASMAPDSKGERGLQSAEISRQAKPLVPALGVWVGATCGVSRTVGDLRVRSIFPPCGPGCCAATSPLRGKREVPKTRGRGRLVARLDWETRSRCRRLCPRARQLPVRACQRLETQHCVE